MPRIFLPGNAVRTDADPVSATVALPNALQDIMTLELRGGTDVETARSEGFSSDPVALDAEPDDILEIKLKNGLRIWQTVESAETDYPTESRGLKDQSLLVPPNLTLTHRGSSRTGGISDYAVDSIALIRGKIVEKAGEMAAVALARRIEDTIKPGFYRCYPPDNPSRREYDLRPATSKDVPADKKVLILLHGTFSSTSGSFGDLLVTEGSDGSNSLWDQLVGAFPGGIYALEHRSVTESPIQNAIDLARSLPTGAQISLMSHSRGGLIAELICRSGRDDFETEGAIDDDDRDIFKKAGNRATQLRELTALKRVLGSKKLRVERLIRVAAPAGGTTLASNRLDRFLSVALNAFELIPALKISPAYDLFQSFMLGLVKTKAKPEELPGLEAMRPTGPLVRMLNRPDVTITSQLHVIAGDNEGKGLFRKLAELAANFFFETENDFVVNTPSMGRGAARERPVHFSDIDTDNITHFSYFRNNQARTAIVTALTLSDHEISAQTVTRGAARLPIPFPPLNGLALRGDGKVPVCFVLPGVMGTTLYQDKDWVWANPWALAKGGVGRLDRDADKVRPDDPMAKYYGDVATFLARSHRVIPFPYDWRLSIQDAATKLAGQVEKVLVETDQPVRFLAHSMGGLVVRAFMHLRPDLWAKIRARRGSRFVMLGTPNQGAFSMVNNLLGRTRQIKLMAAADFKHSKEEMLEIIGGLPGIMQLLPADDNGTYLQRALWEQLHAQDGDGWVIPPSDGFVDAVEGHKLLRSQQLDPETTCYVAGLGEDPTPSSMRLITDGINGPKIQILGTHEGDGTVTWATGIPKGIRTWYMRAVHGDMARMHSSFPALLELLTTGATTELPNTPPQLDRSAVEIDGEITIPSAEIQTYPDAEDLEAALLGGTTVRRPVPMDPAARVHVSIAHGDLRFATYPVAVGHYLDDPITGAEAALDQCLSSHLSKVRDLGLYPGELGTNEVILRDKLCPEGAVVVGLGRFGDLTPGELRSSFRQAVLRYVMLLRRRAEEDGINQADMKPIGLSTLVIGNRGATMTVQQSVEAILEAVADANNVLKETPIATLQFVELFDDTAFRAADALDRTSRNGRVKNTFSHTRQIDTILGARLRAGFGTRSDTWKRMRITRDGHKSCSLRFESIGDGAKNQYEMTAIQPAVMLKLLAKSGSNTSTDRELGRLLFELLVPTSLKTFAKDDQKLLLVVDPETATYPWELLEDDFAVYEQEGVKKPDLEEIKPLVVRTPVIRQLVENGPRVPRANNNNALVIGDPQSDFAPLPGAQNEAREVITLLERAQYQVAHRIRPDDGIEVIRLIMRRPTKILHLAGHGVLADDNGCGLPGMILGDGLRLTAIEVEQMRYVPELVFINCCHNGHIAKDVGAIASNLAHAFIKKGARAVVAAGWEVDDAAAGCFAREFYGSMGNGNSFGDAVHHARIEVYAKHGHTNTWGAYQCYGDQDYRLTSPTSESNVQVDQPRYYSPEHATKAAVNVGRDASTAQKRRDSLLARLDKIEDSAEQEWFDDARWCEAMGRAYAKLDSYDRAITFLEQGLKRPAARASIGAIEVLHDLKVRQATYAWSRADEGKAKSGAAAALSACVNDALAQYGKLDSILAGPGTDLVLTARRECLKGAAIKRRLMVEEDKTRAASLDEMMLHYRAAMSLASEARADWLDPYSTFNWLCGHVIMGTTAPEGSPLETWFSRLAEQGQTDEFKRPSFWNVVIQAEVDILRGLTDPDQNPEKLFSRIEDSVSWAWERGGSYRQARALREQVHFLKNSLRHAGNTSQSWMTRVERFLHKLTWDYRK